MKNRFQSERYWLDKLYDKDNRVKKPSLWLLVTDTILIVLLALFVALVLSVALFLHP